MTALNLALNSWSVTAPGKAARIAIAATGLVLGTVLLTSAALPGTDAWFSVFAGLITTIALVRAAHWPTVNRFGLAAAALAFTFLLIGLL